MLGEQRIIAGQGAQTVRFIPVDRLGRPARVTSATYVIVDVDRSEDDSERTIASGTATLAAVNTTTTAACGYGQASPQQVAITLATDVTAGHCYLLSSDAGGRSLVNVAAITGTTLQTTHRISGAYATGSAFQSIELEATFPLAEANDSEAIDDARRYQCVFTYTLDGETWCSAVMVHLTRYAGEAWITEDYLAIGMPTIADRMRNRLRPQDVICYATQAFRTELASAGQDPEQYRTGDVGAFAIRAKAIEWALRHLAAAGGSDADLALADKLETAYDKLIRQITTVRPGHGTVKLSQGDDQATDPELAGFFRRS